MRCAGTWYEPVHARTSKRARKQWSCRSFGTKKMELDNKLAWSRSLSGAPLRPRNQGSQSTSLKVRSKSVKALAISAGISMSICRMISCGLWMNPWVARRISPTSPSTKCDSTSCGSGKWDERDMGWIMWGVTYLSKWPRSVSELDAIKEGFPFFWFQHILRRTTEHRTLKCIALHRLPNTRVSDVYEVKL